MGGLKSFQTGIMASKKALTIVLPLNACLKIKNIYSQITYNDRIVILGLDPSISHCL